MDIADSYRYDMDQKHREDLARVAKTYDRTIDGIAEVARCMKITPEDLVLCAEVAAQKMGKND